MMCDARPGESMTTWAKLLGWYGIYFVLREGAKMFILGI